MHQKPQDSHPPFRDTTPTPRDEDQPTVPINALHATAFSPHAGTGEQFGKRILLLRQSVDLPRRVFALVISVSERSLASYENGYRPVTPAVLRRFIEFERFCHALAEIVQPEAIGPWLQQPNDAFDGFKPLELIDRGEMDRLWQMIFNLRSGLPA